MFDELYKLKNEIYQAKESSEELLHRMQALTSSITVLNYRQMYLCRFL